MIYVASSWRCPHQPEVVKRLRQHNLEVYDFKNPEPGEHGFSWSEIDPNWQNWTPLEFRIRLNHAFAEEGFSLDMKALRLATETLLVLPCGRSAHLELGYAVGYGQDTAVLMLPDSQHEPELMYKMVGNILISWEELDQWAEGLAHKIVK